MSETIPVALFVGVTFIVAGFIKGVVGMGLPTVAMGLLSLAMPPAAAAVLLIVPSLVTNIWQLLAGPKLTALVQRFASMMLALVAGTLLSIGVLTGDSSSLASAALGAILAAYGVLGLTARKFAVAPGVEARLSPVIGLFTGLITGATGVFAIPVVPYLNSLGLAKDELIQALGLAFTVATLALAAALALAGKFQPDSAGGSLLAVAPALVGMYIGQQLRNTLQPQTFRRWFFIGLTALGSYMFATTLLPE